MKSVLLTSRQRSITVPGRNPGASRVRDRGNAIFIPVFIWVTCRRPSTISLNLMLTISSRRWPVTSARSIARGNHTGRYSAAVRVALYVSSCRRSLATLISGARVGSTGFVVILPSTIASRNMSDSTDLIAPAIVFLPSAIHDSRNSAICRVVTSASIISPIFSRTVAN
ncbi:Uncharacterised protein [Salmonella enterica subsp. enterica serovar Bovismorbificans]|nr:Uncharacterised protein [Salmonella enterica subsp. enterica serovar Bovismorbificans]CNU01261.1 Uncharacterised protein [Salmonella enterica subsp. enterica serovar Bovismorbificans]CQB62211.1 Uncharacterised protein [Salmonella enterica subsp. enterica serovar Bovismorbificans]